MPSFRKKRNPRPRITRRNLVVRNKYARHPRSRLGRTGEFALPLKNGNFITSSGDIVSKTGKIIQKGDD